MPIEDHMTRRKLVAAGLGVLVLAGVLAGGLVLAGGGSSRIRQPDPPVGAPLLPDIVPVPPGSVRLQERKDRWQLRFSTTMVNAGRGDFILRATRDGEGAPWTVEQDIPYSEGGAEIVPLTSRLVWGGDGHDHWHVKRVAINRLVPLDSKGRPVENGPAWPDAKVGFCFYDLSLWLGTGPADEVYSHESCGERDDDEVGMGLSVGWGDTYPSKLPGQFVDVTDIPDGRYRLWVEADATSTFREARRDNNLNFVDLALSTKADGSRALRVIRKGPPAQGP
jgi:hypothetical protein